MLSLQADLPENVCVLFFARLLAYRDVYTMKLACVRLSYIYVSVITDWGTLRLLVYCVDEADITCDHAASQTSRIVEDTRLLWLLWQCIL